MPNTFDSNDFASKLSFLIKHYNVTLSFLAEITGKTKSTISSYLRNQVIPQINTVFDLANHFNIPIEYLLDSNRYSLENLKEYLLNPEKEESDFLKEKLTNLIELNNTLKQELEAAKNEIENLKNQNNSNTPIKKLDEIDSVDLLRDWVIKGHFEAIFSTLKTKLKMREELDALILIEALHSDNEKNNYINRIDKTNYNQIKQQVRNGLLNLINKIPNQF